MHWLLFFFVFLLSSHALAQPKAMPVTCDGDKILIHDLVSNEAHTLWSKGASECVVDNHRRVIWFVDDRDLKFYELSNGRVRRVVRHVDRYIIEGNDNRLLSPGVLARPITGGTTTLKLDSGKVELQHDPRPDPWAQERDEPLQNREPKLVSKEILKDLAQRLPSRQPTCENCFEEARYQSDVHEFTKAYRDQNCQQKCGAGWAIRNSRFFMLNITDGCGDHCYQNLALYDPERKVFIDPLRGDADSHSGARAVFWKRPTYSLRFDRTGARVLVAPRNQGTILMTTSFRRIAELDGVAAGWLYAKFSVKVDEAKPNDFSYEEIGRACLRAPGISKVRLSFHVDQIGRASDVKIRGGRSHAERCVAARIVMQKWHREGPHRVEWNVEQPLYFR